MAPRLVHLEGSAADHAMWSPEWSATTDDFDAEALERAMIQSRETAYRALAGLDAA